MNAKEMIARNAKKGTKFFYADRVEIRIIEDYAIPQKDGSTKIVHRKGQIKTPHRLMAEQLVMDGIAEYTNDPRLNTPYKRNERFGKPEKRERS